MCLLFKSHKNDVEQIRNKIPANHIPIKMMRENLSDLNYFVILMNMPLMSGIWFIHFKIDEKNCMKIIDRFGLIIHGLMLNHINVITK